MHRINGRIAVSSVAAQFLRRQGGQEQRARRLDPPADDARAGQHGQRPSFVGVCSARIFLAGRLHPASSRCIWKQSAVAPVTPEEFDALFDMFHHTVARLEALPAYDVGGQEAVRIQAFREGRPRPLRSVVTDPWLARIAVSTITAGKRWTRVRVVDEPLTEYQRYQLASHQESQAAGERVLIAPRSAVGDVGPDFWLFDEADPDAHAVAMCYDAEGHWLGATLVTDRDEVRELGERLQAVVARAVPLNEFLAGVGG
jgi:hypothetical protein